MEGDPTGGMWIYLIFLIIPLARIIPRLLRKYRSGSIGARPDQPNQPDHREEFFTNQRMPEPSRSREPEPQPEPQPEPDKKDGWVGKDDFK
jgi:hypothetical protein